MIISFKFSIFDLEVKHKILKELGDFTIFCMKAISNDMGIKDISDIVQINEIIIKKQLAFAISRKYLTDDFILTDKGIETVKLFEFINIVNQQKIKIALEHYIESNSKFLYLANNIKFQDDSTGYLVKDNLYDYKMKYKFDEIIDQDKNKIKDLILNNFENYKIIIEKYLDDFIFTIDKNEKQKFYNYEIDEDNFISELNNIQSSPNNSYISIDIPILEVNKIITSDILDGKQINKIKSKFNKYKYFNLLNGALLDIKNYQHKNSNLKIESIIKNKYILTQLDNIENFSLDELLFVDTKTSIRNFYETKFFDITKIMESICEM